MQFFFVNISRTKCQSKERAKQVHTGEFVIVTNLTQFFNVFIYFTSLHVSSNPVLIIRRINCIKTSSGMYHSV